MQPNIHCSGGGVIKVFMLCARTSLVGTASHLPAISTLLNFWFGGIHLSTAIVETSHGHCKRTDQGDLRMFRRPKTLTCPGGEWTTVIRTRFAQLPVTWTIRVDTDLDAISGEFEETKSMWVFPGTPTTGPLQSEMVFERGYWNTFYSVRIRPVETVTVTIQ